MRLISFTLVTWPSTWPLLMASVNPACTAALSCSTPEAKLASGGKLAGLHLSKPGVQPLPFALARAAGESPASSCRLSPALDEPDEELPDPSVRLHLGCLDAA